MLYKTYSCEIIDGDIDFIERGEEKGKSEDLNEMKKLANTLDRESRRNGSSSTIHLIYDENDHRVIVID